MKKLKSGNYAVIARDCTLGIFSYGENLPANEALKSAKFINSTKTHSVKVIPMSEMNFLLKFQKRVF